MCCPNRIARLTHLAGIKAETSYKLRPGTYGGRPAVALDNRLDRQVDVAAPDKAWVTDITYIRTCEGSNASELMGLATSQESGCGLAVQRSATAWLQRPCHVPGSELLHVWDTREFQPCRLAHSRLRQAHQARWLRIALGVRRSWEAGTERAGVFALTRAGSTGQVHCAEDPCEQCPDGRQGS